ncbi:MAG: NAD(P)/FAD-dependent oxidoreductase [Acidimicrobiales bacterium]|nr:NAD(P)/FAD-dependent oxidoreductase [Acidimicrobiales bacterium]MCB9396052.1 NAD(P)/FAD-dependent oxidoreductase [Acidimicrobiaceae bacterium]
MGADSTELGFDPDALRDRYRSERDKRVRTDGSTQYLEVAGEYARFAEHDPYADPTFTRAPISEDLDLAIIGGGFSGLLAAARLREQGVDSFRVIEAGGDFGGTWYWNRYPGAQCDTESYCYLPLLEELGYMPRERYSYADEIFEHSQRIGRHYDLYSSALFQTRVGSIEWDDTIDRWHVRTQRGDDLRARFVIMALGPMSRPKLPGIPGIGEFEGHSFHSSRWDYGYTGGDTTGGMTGLADQRVAVIGSGATAIQCVPRVARDAQHVYLFQRTPSTVWLRRNRPTDPEWFSSQRPGWQRERRENFAAQAAGEMVEDDLIDDSWTEVFRAISAPKGEHRPRTKEERDRVVELSDMALMEQIRRRVDDVVRDPATREALKPYYRVMCKRPTFNDEFLECFNRPNVTLVDVSESQGVERITPRGVVAGGVEYEVDCIVYASGFEMSSSLRRRLGLDIVGRDGETLSDHWSGGLRTLHGFMTRGFPNWFWIGVSQNAFSLNMTSMFDDQARHIAYVVAESLRRGAATVEPTEAAQDDWVSVINGFYVGGRSFLEACTPGYYNNEGSPLGGSGFFGAYTPGINAFNRLLEQWRADGAMAGLELRDGDGAELAEGSSTAAT